MPSENDYVWCRFDNDVWPGLIINPVNCGFSQPKQDYLWIFWFGDHRISEMHKKRSCDFVENFTKFYGGRKKKPKRWMNGVLECIREYGRPLTNNWADKQLIQWATEGFVTSSTFVPQTGTPDNVKRELETIKNHVNETMKSEGKTLAAPELKEIILKCLQDWDLYEKYKFCFGCYNFDSTEEHPIFKGNLCVTCKDNLKLTLHSYGDDCVMYYCIVCTRPGNTVVCSSIQCGRVFCYTCLDDLASDNAKLMILAKEEWYCFVCVTDNKICGLLRVREDWKQRVHCLFKNSGIPMIMPPSVPEKKSKIRVLSLFDGIGTGLLTLNKLNIVVDKYYTSEIDEDALVLVKTRFPKDCVINLHDIKLIDNNVLNKIVPIDLVLAGSPCNDLSIANPQRKGLYDPDGTGILFFDFYRILKTLKEVNNKNFFWLFENVSSMSPECKAVITRFLQCEPSVVDAIHLSPQKRQRLFWGNLPSLEDTFMEGDGPKLQDYLFPHRTAKVDKIRTVTTKSNSLFQVSNDTSSHPVLDYKSTSDTLWIGELENIFGYPTHFTDVANLSVTKRQQLIGRAWSVQSLQYLLRCLRSYYKTTEEYIL